MIITALFGRGEMVFGQSGYVLKSIDAEYYADVKTLDNNLSNGRITLTNECKINNNIFTTTFTIGDNVNYIVEGMAFKVGSGKRYNNFNYSINSLLISFNLRGLRLKMNASSKLKVILSPLNGNSKEWTLTTGKQDLSLSESDINNSSSIKISYDNATSLGPIPYLHDVTYTYTLSYYELDISSLNTAIEEAKKVSVNELGDFTKKTFTEAFTNANTVKAESAFPTSYWDGSNSQGKQNPTTVNNATSALRRALELAIAYLEAKAEINNLKAQGDSWPEGLSVNIDNALTALDNATDINGINNAKNQINIVLERNLPEKKFFTLTLPFDYNLNGIKNGANVAYAAQLALVTHNEKDCYTLYFKQVEDGQMRANQPYIVWLPVGLPDFGNVVVNFGEEGSITVNGWTMQGNYTPNTPMNGNFGIAKGLLCKGEGENAKINAYTAYFIPPTHSHGTENVRARVAVMDEGGNTTYIGELKDLDGNAPEEVFGIDGTRLPEMRKGINIVRQKDGSVRKIVK